MFTLLMTLTIIVAILLILVVLAQNSKGGGLTSQFGGSGASNMIGVKKTGDLLERITWGLAIALVVLALSSKFIMENGEAPTSTSTTMEKARQEQQALPSLDINQPEEGEAAGTETPTTEGSGSLDELSNDEESSTNEGTEE